MKRNFLITTGIKDTWEFYENNFLLGKWCEFGIFGKEKLNGKVPQETSTIKNACHWNVEKRIKDYEYIKNKKEYLLELISEKLSIIHKVDENKEYWRVIIFNWLTEYTATIFYRWESIRMFFKKNNKENFYSNFIPLNDSDYIQENHINYTRVVQRDEWNHLVFLRMFRFLNISNLSLIEKKITRNNLKRESSLDTIKPHKHPLIIKLIDNIISKFAFRFNKVIFESFYFPKKEYLQICLKHKLIPSKYNNFFDFDIKENGLSKDNKRIEFKNLLLEVDTQDKFIKFLLSSLHKDIPKSYLENLNRRCHGKNFWY